MMEANNQLKMDLNKKTAEYHDSKAQNDQLNLKLVEMQKKLQSLESSAKNQNASNSELLAKIDAL